MIEKVLAIETSCDDTSVALVGRDGAVFSVLSANQDLAHAPYGGIVPEIACRNHSIALLPLIEKNFEATGFSWADVGGIAVTNRPGLMGSLIVGLVTAKSLAHARSLPLIGVNHLEGHLLAPFLRDGEYSAPADFDYPYLALAVSGGHTSLYLIKALGEYEILGATLDDAAGEAFDKFAKMMGLGFPGGVRVDQLAAQAPKGAEKTYTFPRGLIHEENFNMSFSGLKSSAQRLIESLSEEEIETNKLALCASYQEAIVDALMAKINRAVDAYKINRVVLTGGVSANSRLRSRADEWARRKKVRLVIPPIRYCTDNAAMIGLAGILRLNRGERDDLNLAPSPQVREGDFIDNRA